MAKHHRRIASIQATNKARKAALLDRLPRAFRRKLSPEQLRDLGLAHNVNLNAIASGEAGESMIWDYVGGVFTWWKVSRMLQIGEPEMDVQLEVATRLVERFGRTNRVLFDGPDLQLARTGVIVMDMLAELVDQPTASLATDWAEAEIHKLAAMVARYSPEERRAAA